MAQAQHAIYHEGGDSYRPIIIIQINNPALWPNDNIAYYRSSGRSNTTPQYTNTWFPFGGIIEQNKTIIRNDTLNKGHLIKMSDLISTSTYFRWKSTLLMNYFSTKQDFHPFRDVYYEPIQGTMRNVTTTETTHFREAEEIRMLLDHYFLFDWQLRISAQIGGGYWAINTTFCRYVLDNINLPPNVVIPVVPANLNVTEPELANLVQDVNTDDIIKFLKDNRSQIETVNFFTQFTNLRPETVEDIINQHNYTPLIQRGTAVINNLIRASEALSSGKYKVAPRRSTREDNNVPPPRGPPVELPPPRPPVELPPPPVELPPPKEKRKFSEVNEDKDVGGTMKRQGKRKGKGQEKSTKKRRKGTKKRRKNTKKRRNSNKRK